MRGLLLKSLSRAEAERASAGWGGDRAYLFERGAGESLFVWQTVWDAAGDAREFFRAYNALVAARGAKSDAGGDASEKVWREGETITRVRVEGDSVLILRGRSRDVSAAL